MSVAPVLLTADGVMVVRTAASWSVTPSTRRRVIDVTVEQLTALLAGALGTPVVLDPVLSDELVAAGVLITGHQATGRPRPAAPGTDAPHPSALSPGAVVEPRAAVVGRIVDGAVELEAVDGARLCLDAVDIQLIDTVDCPTTVTEAITSTIGRGGSSGPDEDELARRLARIARSGRLHLVSVPEPHTEDSTEDSAEDDDRGGIEVAADPDPGPGPGRSWVRVAVGPAVRIARRLVRKGTGAPRVEPAASVPPDLGEPAVIPWPVPTVELEVGPAAAEPVADDGLAPVDYLESPFPGGTAGPVPVYAMWPAATGPVLALGLLTAAARQHDQGRLNQWYEIRRPEDPRSFLADIEGRTGPAVLLLSNYVWSIEENLEVARRGRALCPELVVVHGGPSTPKYEADVERFFDEHRDLVDVTVRGEGEATLVAILDALGPGFPNPDLASLDDVTGLSYRDPRSGAVVRTEDRDRIAALDDLPSPYLTGEFDHIPVSAWDVPSGLLGLVLESNRGCPYGCTFCDWGSSTLSRIRKFSLDRVEAEMRWAAERGHGAWMLADANFGIMSRDVELADRLVAVKSDHGFPSHLGFNVAKNTTKHLTSIIDTLVGAGVTPHFSLALQTRDEATLAAVDRTNISTDHYLALAAAFRRRTLPLDADLMVGLPGQTVDSFADDLQFLMDHEIPARMWITELLPNAPMNDPAYRARHAIVAGDNLVLRSTSSFTAEDRETMMRLRHAYTAFERFGLLRHVVRHAQWDHGVPAMAIIRRIVEVSDTEPDRYPLLNWVMRYFDFYNVPPLGWRAFFAEVGGFLDREFGIGPSPDREVVMAAQAFLLPDAGRQFPDALPLDHDIVAYVRDHTRGLWGDGPAAGGRRLSDYGPALLTVYGDPLDRCGRGLAVNRDPRNEVMTENFWLVGHWELDSPLAVNFTEVAGAGSFTGIREAIPGDLGDAVAEPGRRERLSVVSLSGADHSTPAGRV